MKATAGSKAIGASVDAGGSPATTGSSADGAPAPAVFGDAGIAACDHYFEAQYTRCGGPRKPESETSRLRARFERMCMAEAELPGSEMTPAAIESCAAALDPAPCELPEGLLDACDFRGSLPAGAICNEDVQCQSGSCSGTKVITPGGPIAPTGCGRCEALAGVGEVCAHAMLSARCPRGSTCLLEPATGNDAEPVYECMPILQGDLDDACDGLASRCKPGLFCSSQTSRCRALGAEGEPCGEGPSGANWAGGCLPPLACVGIPGEAKCGLSKQGEFCLSDLDCTPGLGCVPGPCAPSGTTVRIGCAASGTCQAVAWATAREPCDDASMRCLEGACSATQLLLDGSTSGHTCPTLVADDEMCVMLPIGPLMADPCDAFAECFSTADAGIRASGKCTLEGSSVCR